MSDQKERSVELGCGAMLMAALILACLWNIADRLADINKNLTMIKCLYEAAHGALCPEAKK